MSTLISGKQQSYLHSRVCAQIIMQWAPAENLQPELLCLIKIMPVQWPLSLCVSYPILLNKALSVCISADTIWFLADPTEMVVELIFLNIFFFFNKLLLFLVLQVFSVLPFPTWFRTGPWRYFQKTILMVLFSLSMERGLDNWAILHMEWGIYHRQAKSAEMKPSIRISLCYPFFH